MSEIIDKIFVFGFLAFAGIFMLVIISLPTVVAYFLNRWLTKKGYRFIGIGLLIIAPIWTAYETYTAVYPTDSFYFSEFETVTKINPPESANIIRKEASYPDFHGDYCSASLMELSKADYEKLISDLTLDKKITENTDGVIGSQELDKVMGTFKTEDIEIGFTRHIEGQEDHYLFIGFLNDKKSVVISVCVT